MWTTKGMILFYESWFFRDAVARPSLLLDVRIEEHDLNVDVIRDKREVGR
jgi:hypothetical protein